MNALAELWTYRNLIYNLAQRELRSRYKKSVLGWLWSLINPAANLAIYTLVFGYFFNTKPPDAAGGEGTGIYAVYLFAGLVAWNFFNATLVGSIGALQGAGGLLNKVYFPPACPAIANLITVLLQALIEGVVLAVVIMAGLRQISFTFLLFPFILVMVGLFGLGIGLFLSVYNVRYRDVNYMVSIGMQVLFYATPIIYPLSILDKDSKVQNIARPVIKANPLTQYIEWMRGAFYTLQMPSGRSLLFGSVAGVLVFVGGWAVFTVKTRNIAEEL